MASLVRKKGALNSRNRFKGCRNLILCRMYNKTSLTSNLLRQTVTNHTFNFAMKSAINQPSVFLAIFNFREKGTTLTLKHLLTFLFLYLGHNKFL